MADLSTLTRFFFFGLSSGFFAARFTRFLFFLRFLGGFNLILTVGFFAFLRLFDRPACNETYSEPQLVQHTTLSDWNIYRQSLHRSFSMFNQSRLTNIEYIR